MPDIRENDGYDDQDGAEAFDEANLDEHEELNEMRTFEELPDLFDEHAHAQAVVLDAIEVGPGHVEAAQGRLGDVVDVLGLAGLYLRGQLEQLVEVLRRHALYQFVAQDGDGIRGVEDPPVSPGSGGCRVFGLEAGRGAGGLHLFQGHRRVVPGIRIRFRA